MMQRHSYFLAGFLTIAAATFTAPPVIEAGRLTLQMPDVTYSTTFGGGTAQAIEVQTDSDGNMILIGDASSTNLPLVNAADEETAGREAYIAKLNAAGDAVLFSSYLGGSGEDFVKGLTLDASGNMYVVGTTLSVDFPVLNALQPTIDDGGSGFFNDAFVAKFDSDSTLR